ncbi:alpha/beta fold hydrolase [Sphingomonas sp. Leaf28]|uniref:alpha/beta hydrolase n=1 Tax=Sphingomonas sp. Leaf28 TaxID=1735695 RepID=UPI0009ECBFBE|nr:alpha/beta fold hydrolase [Sphingomonas sp. Leaf28]
MTSKGRAHIFVSASLYLILSGPVHAHADASPAALIQAEQVRIKSEPGVMLAGELHVPRSGETRKPAVLLLGGGGASPHGIYPLLEARLHAKGIVTLSFDKRGVGQSTGTFDDAMEPAQRDARAALAYLRSRGDLIDKDRIAILGLSQGAVIGPALAVENPPIAAVVALAAPAGERGVMFLDAMRLKLATSGMESKAVEDVVGATRFYLNALTTTASRETIAGGRMSLVQSFVAGGWKRDQAEGAVKTLADPATSSLYTVAASQILSQVRAPVLAIYAADDTVVSSALSIPEARRALSKNNDATIVEMPNVEHGFKPLVLTASGKRDYQGWPISDPATLDLINDWLPQRLLKQ